MLGGRLAKEAILSGVGNVYIWDFDRTEAHNLGNQFGRIGHGKTEYLVAECDALRPGHCRGIDADIRHTGIKQLQACDILVDCTDDPRLAWTLTEISNGIGRPLLRAAVDGTGQQELGRVLASGTAPDSACQLCSFALDDVIRHRQRRSCPGSRTGGTTPTLAGGALGSVVAGIALLQAQRLQTGNDLEHVIDREIVVDLTNMQLHELRLERSDKCLSGHRRWELTSLEFAVDSNTLDDLFSAVTRHIDCSDRPPTGELELGFYLHPLHTQAYCSCGATLSAVGTSWAPTPSCPECGTATQWLEGTQVDRLTRSLAAELHLLERPLAALGLPTGVMVLVHTRHGTIRRLVTSN